MQLKRRPRTPEQTERNVEMYARYKLGEPLDSIGKLFNVTRQRVYQICIVMAGKEHEQEKQKENEKI